MTRASTATLLSLDRYAKIMGINPMHFAGATADHFFPLRNSCTDIWLQHSWQFADTVSREDLAHEIAIAEVDLARELGWWPAPVWIAQEVHQFPRHYRRDTYRNYGRDVRDQRVGIKTEYAKVSAGGRQAATALDLRVPVVYTDNDADGFAETATVVATTTFTDCFEVHAFFQGTNGADVWEIRPPRSIVYDPAAGTMTLEFWSWQMIDPAVQEFLPTSNTLDGMQAIDLRGLEQTPPVTTNLVGAVDVYRIWNNTTDPSCLLIWEPELRGSIIGSLSCSTVAECEACGLTVQDGCIHVRDALRGIVVPTPATYNGETDRWDQVCFAENRDPDFVKIWYYCGDFDNRYLSGHSFDPLSDRWAKAIAQLATARLERPLCSCGNLTALTTKWQQDAAVTADGLNVSMSDLENPFGTRYGEILAWREVRRERHIIRGGGAI